MCVLWYNNMINLIFMLENLKPYPWKKIFDLIEKYAILDLLVSEGKKPECYKNGEVFCIEDANVVSTNVMKKFLNKYTSSLERKFFDTNGYLAFVFEFHGKIIRGRLYIESLGNATPHLYLHVLGKKDDITTLESFKNAQNVYRSILDKSDVIIYGNKSSGKTQFTRLLLEHYEKPALFISDCKEVFKKEKSVKTLVYPNLKVDLDEISALVSTYPFSVVVFDHPGITEDKLSELKTMLSHKQIIGVVENVKRNKK